MKGPRLENVDIFYGCLEYFTDIWNFDSHLVCFLGYFSGFGIMQQEKSGNPGH
jgi:hypothetical protein